MCWPARGRPLGSSIVSYFVLGLLKYDFTVQVAFAFERLDDRDQVFGRNVQRIQRIRQTFQFGVANFVTLFRERNQAAANARFDAQIPVSHQDWRDLDISSDHDHAFTFIDDHAIGVAGEPDRDVQQNGDEFDRILTVILGNRDFDVQLIDRAGAGFDGGASQATAAREKTLGKTVDFFFDDSAPYQNWRSRDRVRM